MAFLVVAELAVPQGSLPRPDQWIPGIRRTAERAARYSQMVRIALRHRLVPFKLTLEQSSAASAERTSTARALKAALQEAGGAFVKLGQVLSTREDILPTEFVAELATLQQKVPPMPWSDAEAVLVAELGRPLQDVFADIDQASMAAASIGQVHLATLTNGDRVAVKIQRQGIIPLVERDVAITRRIAARLAESLVWARQFGVARHLGAGAALDVAAFMQVIALLSNHRLALPAQLTVAVRALGTVEGTLRVLSPEFDFIAEASAYADRRIADAKRPDVLARSLEEELLGLVPLMRELPHRLNRITGSLAEGRLGVNVRLLADARDRDTLRQFINLGAITFLAGVFGLMAAMLLTSQSGPSLTPSLTLFQLFGYLLVLVSSVLTSRVLFDVFGGRLRQ